MLFFFFFFKLRKAVWCNQGCKCTLWFALTSLSSGLQLASWRGFLFSPPLGKPGHSAEWSWWRYTHLKWKEKAGQQVKSKLRRGWYNTHKLYAEFLLVYKGKLGIGEWENDHKWKNEILIWLWPARWMRGLERRCHVWEVWVVSIYYAHFLQSTEWKGS